MKIVIERNVRDVRRYRVLRVEMYANRGGVKVKFNLDTHLWAVAIHDDLALAGYIPTRILNRLAFSNPFDPSSEC